MLATRDAAALAVGEKLHGAVEVFGRQLDAARQGVIGQHREIDLGEGFMREFVRRRNRLQHDRRAGEIAAVSLAAYPNDMPLARWQAVRKLEAKAVAAIADPGGGQVRAV